MNIYMTNVAEKDTIVIESINVRVAQETRLPKGVTTLSTPTKAEITYKHEDRIESAEIQIAYDTTNYRPEEGVYILAIETVQSPYILPETVAKTAEIKIEVLDIEYKKSGDVYCFDNAMINVVADARGDYSIKDAAELYTYYDKVNILYALEISGQNPGLIINSPVVYVESDITFKDIQGNADVNIAKSLVTKIRTDCPDRVMVNGILLAEFSEKMVTEISGNRGTFFLNGIPSVIMRGSDGGTYAYRSYDMMKLSETNLMSWDVSGGSYGADSVTTVTNIRFESGTVYRVFGAGQGTTLDATLVIDGGAVADSTYGGAMENGTVLKVTIVYEYGDSKKGAYLGGLAGSVVGEPSKNYVEGEYSAEVWYFNYAVHYLYLGGKDGGNIYGNVKFEQYGGSHLYLYTGGNGESAHYGDADITVYGGIWELNFIQQAMHYGNAKLKLYKGIVVNESVPNIQKQNSDDYVLDVDFFEHPDNFRFIEYFNKREEMIDTSEDTGKLVIRFLENRIYDGTEKGHVKIREGSGDTIYITFPNGKNMLIDTGYEKGAQYIIEDLRDLGVTKIDYFMISHKHVDHIGAVIQISEAFEVETFLVANYIAIADKIQVAAGNGNSEVMRLGNGDSLDFGEVHIDIINPDAELYEVYTDMNDRSIAMVITYGDSKMYSGGDATDHIVETWLKDERIRALLSKCTLIKLNHHGIQNTNSPDFLMLVNADKYVLTQMGEYGSKMGATIARLQALGVTWKDIYVTGRHGMIKAVLNKNGTVDMSSQYVKTTPYFADYSELDNVCGNIDDAEFTLEELQVWNDAVNRIKRDYSYEEQAVVNGLVTYISNVMGTLIKKGKDL